MPAHSDFDQFQENNSQYSAIIDFWRIEPETMTDLGIPVSELDPIKDAHLSPGDPSPIGRSQDGDLAYPIFHDRGILSANRKELLLLAYLVCKHFGITAEPNPPYQSNDLFCRKVLSEAVPDVLFYTTDQPSNHQKLAYSACIEAVIAGHIDEAEQIIKDTQS